MNVKSKHYFEQQHHYVPRCYFRPWEYQSREVFVYERKGDRVLSPYRQSTKKICVQAGLYAYSASVIPERRNVLENGLFQKIDSDAAGVLRQLNSCDSVSEILGDDLNAFGLFLVSLRIRTPEFFQGVAASAEFHLRKLIREAENEPAVQAVRYHFKDRSFVEIAEDHFRPVLENKGREILARGLIEGKFLESILGMSCSVIDVKKSGVSLLTSDRPLITKWEHNKLKMMSLPISPTRAFIACSDESHLNKIEHYERRRFAELCNISVVQQAKAKAFALDKSHSLRLFKRRLGKLHSILPFSFETDPELLDRIVSREQYIEYFMKNATQGIV